MDITEKLIEGCSPYIGNMVYDIDVRMLFIELLDDPKSQNLVQRLVFPGVIHYEEANQLDAPEDETIDDVMTINRIEEDRLLITTYKKEITLTVAEEPFVEEIDDEA
ncbi:MAG: hypothetical protein R3208_20505 [Ketobacteraceae bacterium]|nr:hypothetical protein [Ketobacteraceae bacterium]